MSNDNDPSRALPNSSAHHPYPAQVEPPGSGGRAASDSIANGIPTQSNNTYPPIPSYTTLYPTAPVSRPRPNDVPEAPSNIEVPDDLQQYTIAHDHTDAGVAPRLPEAFPADLHSLRSSQGPPESLPAYGANQPPRYTPRIENHIDEPETLAMHFFKFGFCEISSISRSRFPDVL